MCVDTFKEEISLEKRYIDTNHKRSSKTDKDETVKRRGVWMTNQSTAYKKNTGLMKNESLRKMWEEFINDEHYKIYFRTEPNKPVMCVDTFKEEISLEKRYIDTNHKRSSTTDKDETVKRRGQWMHTQVKAYKKNTGIMKNEAVRKMWEEFVNDDNYKKYFRTEPNRPAMCVDTFKAELDLEKTYIDTNHKRSSTTDKDETVKRRGVWMTNQGKAYKKNTGLMKDEQVRKEWEEFVNDDRYKIYFRSEPIIRLDVDTFKATLSIEKTYIDTNQKRSSRKDSDETIKRRGQWITNQGAAYKKNTGIMKEEAVRKEWEDFINDVRYKKYFK